MRARIVTDRHAGYEVQVWRWYLPIWMQPRINTHHTVESAERYALTVLKYGASGVIKEVTL